MDIRILIIYFSVLIPVSLSSKLKSVGSEVRSDNAIPVLFDTYPGMAQHVPTFPFANPNND